MSGIYIAPRWFFGYSIALELMFAAVTLAVALGSLYVYRLCEERGCRTFGFGFIAISLSYFVWAGVNLYLFLHVNDSLLNLQLDKLSNVVLVGVYAYMLLMLLGL